MPSGTVLSNYMHCFTESSREAVKQNWFHLYFRGWETGSKKLSNIGDTPSWGSSMSPARQVFLSTFKASTMVVKIKPHASAWQSRPSTPKTWLSPLTSTPRYAI